MPLVQYNNAMHGNTREGERAKREDVVAVVVVLVVRGIAMAVSGDDNRRDSGWEVNQLLVSQASQSGKSGQTARRRHRLTINLLQQKQQRASHQATHAHSSTNTANTPRSPPNDPHGVAGTGDAGCPWGPVVLV